MAILKKTAKAEQAVAEAAVKSAAVEQAPAAVKEEKPASRQPPLHRHPLKALAYLVAWRNQHLCVAQRDRSPD